MKVTVITISDRASRGEYEDLSGPEIIRILREGIPEDLEIGYAVVPDEAGRIVAELDAAIAGDEPSDAVITTGGTGIGPRDITPDISREWCEKELPGIAEHIRSESCKETPMAMLSRGYAGLRGTTVLINLPGSVKAVRLGARLLIPVLKHAPLMIRGEGH